MKKFLAWVLFVFGAVNVIHMGIRVILGEAPTMTDGLLGGAIALLLWAIMALSFYLWWRWK